MTHKEKLLRDAHRVGLYIEMRTSPGDETYYFYPDYRHVIRYSENGLHATTGYDQARQWLDAYTCGWHAHKQGCKKESIDLR